jgi:predicted lactoylglutathione lyase
MDPRINIITLGVEDIERSKKFYEHLGFVASSMSNEHFVAFQTVGVVFCLYPTRLLAEDATVESKGEGFRAVTLAYNVAHKEEVQSLLEHAEKCGAKITKPAQDVFWGGHSGYFADPDGHLWEIAWNPHWALGRDGMLQLPE